MRFKQSRVCVTLNKEQYCCFAAQINLILWFVGESFVHFNHQSDRQQNVTPIVYQLCYETHVKNLRSISITATSLSNQISSLCRTLQCTTVCANTDALSVPSLSSFDRREVRLRTGTALRAFQGTGVKQSRTSWLIMVSHFTKKMSLSPFGWRGLESAIRCTAADHPTTAPTVQSGVMQQTDTYVTIIGVSLLPYSDLKSS